MNDIASPSDPDAPHAPQNELIHRIGGLLAGDTGLATLDWESHALVALFEEDGMLEDGMLEDGMRQDGAFGNCVLRLSGFAYLPTGDYVAATPEDPRLPDAIRALREAMRRSGASEWGACVIRLVRATRRITVEFEYDDPARWAITPATLAQVAQRARPG